MNQCSVGASFPLLTTDTPLCPSQPSLAETGHVNPHPGHSGRWIQGGNLNLGTLGARLELK